MAGILPVALDIAFRNNPLDASPFYQDVTGSYPRAVLADSPVAFWRLNEAHPPTTVYDEHTTVAASARDGTATNGPTGQALAGPCGDGYFGMEFQSASSEYVAVADNAALRGFSAITLECWYYITALPGAIQIFFAKATSAGLGDYAIGINAANQLFVRYRNAIAMQTNASSITPTVGAWTHVVWTRDATANFTQSWYVNGALAETAGSSLALDLISTQPLAIAAYNNPSNYFNGYLCNVAIYGSALSAAQVKAHYRAATEHRDHYWSGDYSAGRPMALGPVSPGSARLEIDDPARWLEPGYASSPYYPNVKRGKKCRLRSTATALFTGFVEAFRTGAYGKGGVNQTAVVQMADPFKLLARRTTIDYSVVRDSFDRADASSLGTPDKGSAWTAYASSGSARISGNLGQVRMAPYLSDSFSAVVAHNGSMPGTAGGAWAVPDGIIGRTTSVAQYTDAGDNITVSETGAADGVLIVSRNTDPSPSESWMVFRYSDLSNFWFLRYRQTGGPTYEYRLFKRVAGADTQVGSTYSSSMSGVRIVLQGNSITVSETGGTARITGSDSFNATATKHGFGGVVNGTFTQALAIDSISFYPASIAQIDAGTDYADGAVGVFMETGFVSATLGNAAPVLIVRASATARDFLFLQVTGDNPFVVTLGRMENGVAVSIASWTVDASNPASYGDSYGGNFYSLVMSGSSIYPIVRYWKNSGGYTATSTYSGSGSPATTTFNQTSTNHGIGAPYGRAPNDTSVPISSYYNFNDFAVWSGRPVELTGARIGALLNLLGWPTADRTLAVGRYQVAALTAPTTPVSSDYTLLNLIQQTAASDGGLFYFNAAGQAIFEGGTTRSTQSRSINSQATFGNGGGTAVPLVAWPERSSEDTDLVNDAQITGNSGVGQRFYDGASITADGSYDYTDTTLNQNDIDALSLARSIVSRNSQDTPETRTLRCDGLNSLAQAQILTRLISDYVTLTWTPVLGGGSFSLALFVEGYSHAFTPSSWAADWQTSARQRSSYWILGDAYMSLLGQTTVLA